MSFGWGTARSEGKGGWVGWEEEMGGVRKREVGTWSAKGGVGGIGQGWIRAALG